MGTVIIGLLGEDPLVAYAALINGALGDVQALANTLQKATPYIFGGLAVMIASKCGMFNIGVEGQMYVGAMAAAWAGFTLTYFGARRSYHSCIAYSRNCRWYMVICACHTESQVWS